MSKPALTPQRLEELKKMAFSEGEDDNLAYDILLEHASLFLDSGDFDDDLNDNERDIIMQAYVDGFFNTTNLIIQNNT